MAFKSVLVPGIGTTLTTICTAAGAVDTTVIGLSLSNVGADPINCDIKIFKSGGTPEVFLIKQVIVPVNDTFVALGGEQKLVLESGDYIQVVSNLLESVDVTISFMEST